MRSCRLVSISTSGVHCRHFATKYTAKVTSTSHSGRSLSAEVSPLQTLPYDSRGYPIPRRNLICRATQLIIRSANHSNPYTSFQDDPFSDLSDYLSSLSLSLTTSEVSEILKSLNSPSLALRFFHFCSSFSPNFQHDSFTYTRIILILSKSTLPNKLDLIRSILAQMETSSICGIISTVNILISCFESAEDLDTCIGLVEKWGLKMNSYTYKCLLQAYLRSRNLSRAFAVYVEMGRKGYKLDIFAYNMLLDALAKDEKPLDRLTRLTRFSKT